MSVHCEQVCACLDCPVCLVYLVSPIQPNKPDRPNRPNEQDRLADFFSILLELIDAGRDGTLERGMADVEKQLSKVRFMD